MKNVITFPACKGTKVSAQEGWSRLTASVKHSSKEFDTAVLCGELSNLTVVDIDVKGGGFDVWTRLMTAKAFGKLKTPVVKTPSGGLHVYFQYEPTVGTSKGLRDACFDEIGIDVRSKGGYVIAPPTKGYVLKTKTAEPMKMPERLRQFIKKELVFDRKTNTLVAPKPYEEPSNGYKECSPDVYSLVMAIDKQYADSYDDWVRILFAIGNVARESKEDLSGLAVEFSKKSHKYMCEADVMQRYSHNGNDSSAVARMGTLVHYAKLSGYKPKHDVDADRILASLLDDECVELMATDAPEEQEVKLTSEQKKVNDINGLIERVDLDVREAYIREGLNRFADVVIECEKPYCADIPEYIDAKENIVAIRSQMGTGKSYANQQLLKKHITDNADFRAGVLSFRVSLASKYKTDYGFKSYLDDREPIKENRWICQVDSLHRVVATRGANDLYCLDMLVIDEVSQVRKHLTSKVYLKQGNLDLNWQKLRFLIKYSKQVVIMDANLSSTDIKWVQQIRESPADKSVAIWNHTVCLKQEIVVSNTTGDDIVQSIVADAKEGRKFFLTHNGSTDRIHAIERMLKDEFANKKFLCICADTLRDESVEKALADTNAEFPKYDGILVSPSVQSGLSFDVKGVIHSVYGIYHNKTNSSKDCCQMIRRVRHPINSVVRVAIKQYNGSGSTDWKTLKREFLSRTEEVRNMVKNGFVTEGRRIDAYGNIRFYENPLFKMIITNQRSTNMDRRFFMGNFIASQVMAGNVVRAESMAVKASVKIEADMSTARANNARDTAKALYGARNISLMERNEIKADIEKKMDVSDDRMLSYNKFRLLDIFAMDTTRLPKDEKDGIDWFMTYGDNEKWVTDSFRNRAVFYDGKRSLTEGLKIMKHRAIEAEATRRGDDGKVVSATAYVASLSADDGRYAKQKVVINWLTTLGFKNMWSREPVVVEGDKFDMVRQDLIDQKNHYKSLFEIKERRYQFVINPKKGQERNAVLRRVNGLLGKMFQLTIKRFDRKTNQFILKDAPAFELTDMFIDPWSRETFTEADKHKPVLGRVELDYLHEPSMKECEDALEALGIQKNAW